MTNKINFISQIIAVSKKKTRKLFLLQITSLIMLIGYLVLGLALFSYSFILKKQSEALQNKIMLTKKRIENQKSVETKQFLLKNKLTSLSEILASQKQNQKIAETVFALIPPGIAISGFSIDEEGEVNFSAKSSTLKDLKNFLNLLETNTKQENTMIKQVIIKGISFDYKKGYTVNINITFAKTDQ